MAQSEALQQLAAVIREDNSGKRFQAYGKWRERWLTYIFTELDPDTVESLANAMNVLGNAAATAGREINADATPKPRLGMWVISSTGLSSSSPGNSRSVNLGSKTEDLPAIFQSRTKPDKIAG